MAERDYSNAWDDWLRDTGGDTSGGIPSLPPEAPPSQGTTDFAPGFDPGDDPMGAAQREAWYQVPSANQNQYPYGDPIPMDTPFGGGGGGRGGGYGGYSGNFNWPSFNAPRYSPGPAFQAPPAFSYEAFTPPTTDSIYADPSYKMRRDEGLQAIEHGAAAKGLSRLPATLQGLAGWNQDFASREYGNIFDRGLQTYGTNRNNAADTYSLNYGVSRDVWDRGEQQNLNTYDRNYRSSLDEFNYNQFEPAKMNFDDMYRRWKAELDSDTQIAGYGD